MHIPICWPASDKKKKKYLAKSTSTVDVGFRFGELASLAMPLTRQAAHLAACSILTQSDPANRMFKPTSKL